MPVDSISSAQYTEFLKRESSKPPHKNRMAAFENELCPNHRLPQHGGYGHSAECKAISQICGDDQNDRSFLLGRLDAMRRYAKADQFTRWPKWARNEVRRAQGYLLRAAKLVEEYESLRKKLEKEITQKLGQDGTGLPVASGHSVNLKQLAGEGGLPLKSPRVYLFTEAQKNILANILHRFPNVESRPLALLLSHCLGHTIKTKNLNEWRKNNRPYIETAGHVVSIF